MPMRHVLSGKRGLPPLGFALAIGISGSTSSKTPLGQEFDGHLTTPVPRDVSTLSQVAGEMRL